MNIDVGRSILIIAVCSLCTFAERLLPFSVFGRTLISVVGGTAVYMLLVQCVF